MTTAEQVKQQFDLLEYIQREHIAFKIGLNTYRVNPCPICGGRDHFTIYSATNSWTTFSLKCNTTIQGGSIIDYLMAVEGVENVAEAIEMLNGQPTKRKASPIAPEKAEKKYDFTTFIDSMDNSTDYYLKRGLSKETVQKYKLSADLKGLNTICETFNIQKPPMSSAYRFILPIHNREGTCTHFIARFDESIYDGKIPEGLPKTLNYGGSDAPYFNERYLYNAELSAKYIFITEGIFDALSVEEIGYQAISVNSATRYSKLIDLIKENEKILEGKTFLIAGDNDEAGQKLNANLITALKDSRLTIEAFNIPDEYKDLNEFLQTNRSEFEAHTSGFIDNLALKDTAYAELTSLYMDLLAGNFQQPIKTCFPKLNDKLGGGLYPGLYVLGAVSSLGKTTMVQQVADGLASVGEHILFFSLEMGKRELISKSLTREMALFKIEKKMPGEITHTRSLMNGDIKNQELFTSAIGAYEKYAKNLFIYEGNFNTTVDEIRSIAEKHFNRFNKKPVIIVDYLQILAPTDPRMTDKQTNDKNVAELKRISRDLNTSVIAISSFNRENYNNTVSFSSFKESGAIEYSADCVIGLELEVVRELPHDKGKENERRECLNKAKEENPRKIRLVILKNRNGASYGEITYKYYPQINKFDEQ